MDNHLNRRGMIVGTAALAGMSAYAQAQPVPTPPPAASPPAQAPVFGTPPSVVTNPPRQWGPDAPPSINPDPDIVRADASFGGLLIGQETIRRLSTGYHLAEGPAWSAIGNFAIFSDVKNDTLYRYIWETGEVTAYRKPSFNTNGNTFDHQGRQISTQDFFRRVIRWESDGSMTIIADNFEGKPLNSPNDVAPHKDGSIWFSDPTYGGALAEGHPDDGGIRDNRIGNTGVGIQLAGGMKQQLPANLYRWDPSGKLEVALAPDGGAPNGLCFSPDYTKLYVIRGSGIQVGDIDGHKLTNMRPFTDCRVDGVRCGPDGMRCDKAGNIWSSSAGPLGYAGVTVWNPAGKLIGRIRLPETCANLCFAGPKRDHLFIAANSSIYMLRLNIQGAAPG